MKIVVPKFHKDFKCIAGACPDSCCQGWEVDVDSASLAYYKTLEGPFRERINSVLDKDEFGNTVFRLAEKKRCPFLNSENLCDLHIEKGVEHTPNTCRMFPKFENSFGGTKEVGYSFSCPVASGLMWNMSEEFDFDTVVNTDPPELNDIDAELYFKLFSARKEAYKTVLDKSKPLNERLAVFLSGAKVLQDEIKPYVDGTKSMTMKEVFTNPENINPEWVRRVETSSYNAKIIDEKSTENVVMYFVFRYYLQASYDSDVLSKAKMAVVGALIPSYFGNEDWAVHLWSKETEHSDVNMRRYEKLLKTASALSYENLMSILK